MVADVYKGDGSTSILIRADAAYRRSGQSLVVAPVSNPSDVALLDGWAATMWLILESPGSVADLTAVMAEHFSRPAGEVHGEVARVVDDLRALGLLIEHVEQEVSS